MCKLLMYEFPVCGVKKDHVELSDFRKGDWGSFIKLYSVSADKFENTEYSDWCRRFQISPCCKYLKTGRLCFGSRGSLRLYARLVACGADANRKLSLLDCRQKGR